MATNISGDNGQAFVEGRRVHHTDMLDGSHDESAMGYGELVGLVDLCIPSHHAMDATNEMDVVRYRMLDRT